jgi:nucleoside-diphosphate-sugar epimerase
VGDVVAANMIATELQLPLPRTLDDCALNVGTGIETTVLELASVLMDVSGRRVEVRHAEERRGELRNSCLDVSRLISLGWSPKTNLRDGLANTYEFIVGKGQGT